MGDLSSNFSFYEFNCHGVAVPKQYTVNLRALVEEILQPIRDEVGVPISISSGYRTPKRNKKVGGTPDSYHLYGLAADIFAHQIPIEELYKAVLSLRGSGRIIRGGVKFYPSMGFVHVDLGPDRTF